MSGEPNHGDSNPSEHFDVIVVGAGLSGIGMACHLKRECPDKRVGILERRDAIGGTWDLFRYPGIRSDSDMFSFGYNFRPWAGLQVLADGPSIKQYVQDTAAEYGVDENIRFGQHITDADWSSADARWTLTATDADGGNQRQFSSQFIILCTGYYNYDTGHRPQFDGEAEFAGQIVHPQHWPESLDYRGKRVVVIGSGATAVTVVPAMAEQAAHVTMLQRSPSYIFSVPSLDAVSKVLNWFLPGSWVHGLARWRNILLQRWIYKAARRWPDRVRKLLLGGVRKRLDDPSQMRHFTPDYKPWDERLCAVPDGNLFEAINSGKASVVTDHIDRFTPEGISLKSGETIAADIIVTATGLDLQMMGGMAMRIDGETRPVNSVMTYKSVLIQDVPNMGYVFGYTNAPWTLKADIAAGYLCRLLKHMKRKGVDVFVPRDEGDNALPDSMLQTLQSGYVQRAQDRIPRQGKELPWKVLDHYEQDKAMLMKAPIDDGVIQFEQAA